MSDSLDVVGAFPQWMTLRGAAEVLGICVSGVGKRALKGRIDSFRADDGRIWVYVEAPTVKVRPKPPPGPPPLPRWWDWHPLMETEADLDGDELAAALARPLVAMRLVSGGGGGGFGGGCGEGAASSLVDDTRREVA